MWLGAQGTALLNLDAVCCFPKTRVCVFDDALLIDEPTYDAAAIYGSVLLFAASS